MAQRKPTTGRLLQPWNMGDIARVEIRFLPSRPNAVPSATVPPELRVFHWRPRPTWGFLSPMTSRLEVVDDPVVSASGGPALVREDGVRRQAAIAKIPQEIVIGRSAEMQKVFEMVGRVAPLPVPVLLLGETGTGKEVFARLIHSLGARPRGPFVPVNLAAIPNDLLESTMFGHERGSFTGAVARRVGKVTNADGGTLFLDEIGEMRVDMQAKVLRFLQEKEYEPVGGSETITSDARLVTATNQDLGEAIAAGRFRTDLLYRMNVVTIRIPPLRQRLEDLDEFVEMFRRRYQSEFQRPSFGVSPTAMQLLHSYAWPGNIRELENRVQRAVGLSQGPMLEPEDFFESEALDAETFVRSCTGDLRTLDSLEESYIRHVLSHTSKQSDAARVLGIDRKTLYKKMLDYGMLPPKATVAPRRDEDVAGSAGREATPKGSGSRV